MLPALLLLACLQVAGFFTSASSAAPLPHPFQAGMPAIRTTRAHREFNRPGNAVIADQFNNRVIEVDLDHDVIWS
ncbi:MAG: hypothetical protein M3Z37_11000, partial [Candidatus Eremiobacteraeota bacterium]|nr:hypothetical protein [Candidatus Eremiobacteraeota bacterium]